MTLKGKLAAGVLCALVCMPMGAEARHHRAEKDNTTVVHTERAAAAKDWRQEVIKKKMR